MTNHLSNPQRTVGIQAERVTNISSVDYPGHYDHDGEFSWDLSAFKKKLHVQVQRLSNRSIDFDLVGVDASIANALRRILIAEVPTVCIENVYIFNNTSVVQDEVLAKRIGLVPLNVKPSTMLMKGPAEQATDRNTLVFRISLACTHKPASTLPRAAPASANTAPLLSDSSLLYENHELLSSHLVWAPQGEQGDVFAQCPPAPTNGNIALAKLRPGQEVDIECHAVKGIGEDHAKFSPVATATYRLLPTITLDPAHPVPPQFADKFAACFPKGIISIDPVTMSISVNESEARRDTMSREVLRHKEFENCVKLGRVRDHFLFKIESEGPYSPEDLLLEAIKVMREKIAVVQKCTEVLLEDVEMEDT